MIGVVVWFTRRMARANSGLSGLNVQLATTNVQLEETSKASAELAHESAIVNQFTELTALTEDDIALSEATLATLDELVRPSDASLHVSNQSQDRAVPQATLGQRTGEILSLHDLGRCPAVRRSSLYVTDDVASRLAFRCPVYPVDSGTLACVPLVALGETVGAVHLHWDKPRELALSTRLAITRVSEHSALSIANRRLLLALRGQANTDARTGLTNSRAFDEMVQRRLAARVANEKAAILMLDLDHFKEFNDRYSYYDGDRVIYLLSRILHDVVKGLLGPRGFVGHIGGDDFIFIIPLNEIGAVCGEILDVFDTLIPLQYNEQDRRAGYFFGKDRRGQLHRVPLMTLSVGIVTNRHRRFPHPAQVSELATEMKSYAKTLPGSVFVVDRRQGTNGEERQGPGSREPS
jgi:diguanylate cyclase (GGDEF)-like protein